MRILIAAAVFGIGVFALARLAEAAMDGGSGGDGAVKADVRTSADVAEAFADAGLEAERIARLTPADLGLSPVRQGEEGSKFLIPSLGKDEGGRTFVFDNLSHLRELKVYYDGFGGMRKSWVFTNEDCGVLVQLNGALPEAQAREYEGVVDNIC